MKRAIIYGRVSTNKQSAESIETQIAECKKWAAENDCQIVDVYDDTGQSGRAYNVGNRTGFQQIKQDAKEGRMDFAIIHKIDRFARSVKDYFGQEAALEEYGVKLIVATMPFLNEADIVVKAIYVAMAEQFSKNLSDEVGTKMKTFAQKGTFLGGKPPYGFVVARKDGKTTLDIDPEKSIAIKMLYENYMKGFGYIQLSRILAEHGFLNNKQEPFTATHIRKMLTSKKYNGWYVWGIRETKDGKEIPTYNEKNMVEIPNVYPKIIEDELFNAVQKKISSNAPRNKRKFRHYPFTGRMVCANCGRSIVGYSTVKPERNNKEYIYYRCNGRKVNGCKLPGVNAEMIENYVAEKLKQFAFDDNFMEQLIAEIESHLSGDVRSFERIRADIESQLTEVNSQIKEATKDKYSRKISEELYDEIVNELNRDKNTLELRHDNVMQQINYHDKSKEIRAYVKHLKHHLEKADADVKNILLQEAVRTIIVSNDKIDIFIHLTKPSPTKKQYRGVNSIDVGLPLFSVGSCQSNIHRGVPRYIVDKPPEVYTGEGMTLIRYTIFDISEFNKG